MFRTIVLFALTNIAIMVMASIVLGLLGIGNYSGAGGIDYGSLMAFCLVWGMVGSLISLLISKWSAKWMMKIQTVTPESPGEYGWVARKVQELARAAQITTAPEVGVYQSNEVNAFATGPSKNNSLVAVSTGLLRSMNQDEIEAVIAHEISHITNGDMVRMTLLQGVINAFVLFLARIIAFAVSHAGRDDNRGGSELTFMLVTIVCQIAFGILGTIIVAWFSRQREFKADAGSAKLAGRGKMIEALQALQRNYDVNEEAEEAQPAAIAAFKISGKNTSFLGRLMATHPPLQERIAALEAAG